MKKTFLIRYSGDHCRLSICPNRQLSIVNYLTAYLPISGNTMHKCRHYFTINKAWLQKFILNQINGVIYTMLRNAKKINLEGLCVMNVGLDKSNFSRDMGYRA